MLTMLRYIAVESSLMPHQHLGSRIAIAVALTAGFYTLAIFIAGGLLVAAHLFQQRYTGSILGLLAIMPVLGAMVIVVSILPARDRFAPGPRLEETAQPELFALIRDVAAATGQPVPHEVYLTFAPNAGVTERGGMAGIGGRRVLFVGLPLLQMLTVTQLRAVMAHEFGHYHAGDTKLAPWIYKTRAVIFRTIENLANHGPVFELTAGTRRLSMRMHTPFLWYGRLFLRLTRPISLAQEYAADRVSAKVAGVRNAIGALLAAHGGTSLYGHYWQHEVVPVLTSGFRPPIGAGLTQFLSGEERQKVLREVVEHDLSAGTTGVDDHHPALRERVQALGLLEDGADAPMQTTPAATLLRDADALEAALLQMVLPPGVTDGLRPIEWPDVPVMVYMPAWRQCVAGHSLVLRELNVAAVSSVVDWLPLFARRLGFVDLPEEEALKEAQGVLGCAVAMRLIDDGWRCEGILRGAPVLTKNGRAVQPFLAVARLAQGEMTAAAWEQECAAAGIAKQRLA